MNKRNQEIINFTFTYCDRNVISIHIDRRGRIYRNYGDLA